MADWLTAGAIGLVSGVLSGAFGIGGGIVTTPAIRLLMDAPALIAVGTPLPVIIPAALTGAISYARSGLADVRSGLVIACAGVPLVMLGAWLETRVGGSIVLLVTALLIGWAAADTIQQSTRRSARTADAGTACVPRPRTAGLVSIGALAGLYSGFLGLGGGFVIVPMLCRWLRFPIKRALGTSLVTVAALAVPGTIAHGVLGNIDWTIAAGLVVGVVPGALIGARLTMGAQDHHVRVAFAILLLAVATWLGASEIGVLAR